MEVRRAVLGDAHVDEATARTTAFGEPFQELITRYAWGEIWARPGLDRRTRSLVTLAMLAGQGREDELRMHLRAALRNGVTAGELQELLLQVGVYWGLPAANAAFRLAGEELEAAGRARK